MKNALRLLEVSDVPKSGADYTHVSYSCQPIFMSPVSRHCCVEEHKYGGNHHQRQTIMKAGKNTLRKPSVLQRQVCTIAVDA
jgi:hypothetical protein